MPEFVRDIAPDAGEREGKDVEGVGQWSGCLPYVQVTKELPKPGRLRHVIVVHECVCPTADSSARP
jgi:hypothetical protein